jgi:RNA polymerase sigma factor (sigma-70 family)
MTDITNQELTRLLKQFALGKTSDQQATRAQRAFYEGVRLPMERAISQELFLRPELVKVAVQDAWNEVFLSARRYDPLAGSVLAWVKGIAVNCARRALREEARAKRLIVSDVFTGNQCGDGDWDDDENTLTSTAACPLPGPEQKAQAGEIRQAIENCLDRLPTDGRVPYRQIYEMALDSELTNRELAELFNAQHPERPPCNEEQLRKWIARAGEKMRQCLSALLRLHPVAAR